MLKGFLLVVVVGLGAALSACGGGVPGALPTQIPEAPLTLQAAATITSPTTVPAPTQEILAEPVSLGLGLYRSKGCAACHGQDAEGTDIAPPLPGHSGAQVKRQARAPLGIMPVFPPDKISNEELEAIAEYVEGLGGGHAHVRAPGSPDEIALHHWMALFSIDAEDPSDAAHHLGHIIDITEGQHRSQMEKALSLLEANETDEAAHLIQQMLAGLEQVDIDEPTMQLTLALSSARVEETDVAIHHVEHFLELATGEEAEAGERILDFLRDGRVLDVQDALENLLGGTPIDEHMEDADEHADEADEHMDDADEHADEADEHMDDADEHADEADEHMDEPTPSATN